MIKKFFGRLILLIIVLACAAGVIGMSLNNHVVNSEKENIVTAINKDKDNFMTSEIQTMKDFDADCVIVLGAGIIDEETPTYMLQDRLDVGVMLYKQGIVSKLLLTGDNGTEEHNEIHVMLNYAKDHGVAEDDIYCDHAGFSTYDSMYRAKNIFGVQKAIIVTQTYHEYRSLYNAEKLGIESIGVSSDQKIYRGQAAREVREVLARIKDLFKTIKKPESTIGGEAISLNESGTYTHGE